MAAREALALNISVPRIEVPQAGDTYLFPRASAFGGNLTFSTDATHNIGAAGANRPNFVYAASGFISGSAYINTIVLDVDASKSKMSSPSDGVILVQNLAGTDFGRLQFGGTTSSFPALKRSSTVVETKLADDSAYAQHAALSFKQGSAGPTWSSGSGSPEGAVTAPIGSLFSRTDGGAATSLYVKESGAGNTGWVAK